jgi:hypothetical protein
LTYSLLVLRQEIFMNWFEKLFQWWPWGWRCAKCGSRSRTSSLERKMIFREDDSVPVGVRGFLVVRRKDICSSCGLHAVEIVRTIGEVECVEA